MSRDPKVIVAYRRPLFFQLTADFTIKLPCFCRYWKSWDQTSQFLQYFNSLMGVMTLLRSEEELTISYRRHGYLSNNKLLKLVKYREWLLFSNVNTNICIQQILKHC